MSVFGSIVSAIFGSKHAAGVTPTAGTSSVPPSSTGTSAPAGTGAALGTSAAAKPISRADVEAILKKLDDDQDEDFEWGKSITDLMKLLKLDSSLGARKHWQRNSANRRLVARRNECLAAQAGHDKTRRERRQGAGQSQGIGVGRAGPQRSCGGTASRAPIEASRRRASRIRLSVPAVSVVCRCCSFGGLSAAELLDRLRPGRELLANGGCRRRLSERDRSAREWCLERGQPVRNLFRCPSLLKSRLPAAELLDRVRPGRRTVGQRLGWRRRHSERDRCARDWCLHRGRPARRPFRCLSFLGSRLPAAELLDRSHPSAQARSLRGQKLAGRRLGRRRCGRNIDAGHSGAVEHQPLRTFVGRPST